MTTSLGWLLIVLAGAVTKTALGGENCQDPDRLIVCHIETNLHPSTDPCYCTHLVIHNPHDAEVVKAAERLREKNRRLKILSLAEEGKRSLLDDSLSGVYLRLSKTLSKEQVVKQVKILATEIDNQQASKAANAKYSTESSVDIPKDIAEILLELPSAPEQLAKNYDLKSLNKYVNYFIITSNNLTDSSEEGLAYHPSRLMGIDDILNADSLVDLISGLGAEHEKLLISLPATALKFNLKDANDNMPRAKVTGPPGEITQKELCSLIENGAWTLERDEDQTAPYAYSDKTWLAFDDSVSAAIKAKYILLRGLAGISITKSEADDWSHSCASRPILDTIYSTFTNLVRKPRAATLLSLQDQIHNSITPFAGDVQLSPFRIVRVVDRAGSVHVVRKEAKTEFQCSRQGYFTHPSGCNRFYRCVKFNQYSSDFTVFEYDCPAGLAFDERYEVCVWPGSLPDASACKGSSEIAPVPRSRYACSAEGYFADPENCRWFFACLDHHGDGSAPTAYEFRCPFGLVFNEGTLTCDWPWSVPGCGSGSVIHSSAIYPGDILEGRLRPAYAQVSDVHVSGGRIANVDGGLVLGTNLLSGISASGQRYSNGYNLGLANQINSAFGSSEYEDKSGAYIHDPTGDTGGQYLHEVGPNGPGSYYSGEKGTSYGSVSGPVSSGQYVHDYSGENGGQYSHTEGLGGSTSYVTSSGSHTEGLGGSTSYVASSGSHTEGLGGSTSYVTSPGASDSLHTVGGYSVYGSGSSGLDNSGAYVHDSRGDNGGAYIHQEGPAGPNSKPYLYSGSAISGGAGTISGIYSGSKTAGTEFSGLSGANLGVSLHQSQQGVFGSKVVNTLSSGAYIHDLRGDNGGAYIHQEGPSGPGAVPYVHQEDLYRDSGHASGFGIKAGQGYTSQYVGQNIVGIGGYTGGSYSSSSASGQYIHDSSGDVDGGYNHQQGLSYYQGIYAGKYSGQYIHDNSGAYVHDTTGDHAEPYIHQEGPSGPIYHDINVDNVYTSHYGGQYASKYATDQNKLINYANIHSVGAHLYQPHSGVIHTYDSSRLNVQPLGYVESGIKPYQQTFIKGQNGSPVSITKFSSAPLNPVQYLSPVPNIHPISVSTPAPAILTEIKSHNIQPITVTKEPAIPLNPVQYVAPLKESIPVLSHTYQSPVIKTATVSPFIVSSTPSVPVGSIQPLSPIKTHVVQPIHVSTPSPIISYEAPVIKTQTLRPITVTSSPVIPLNVVQYKQPVSFLKTVPQTYESIGVSTISPPIIKTQHVQPIIHSHPVVSTPATPIASYEFNPIIKTGSVKPVTVTSAPVIPFNPVQYGQKTIVSTALSGYDYPKPKVTFTYPQHIFRHQPIAEPVPFSPAVGYAYHPSVSVPAVNTIVSQPVIKTNVVKPVVVSSTPRPEFISYNEPVIKTQTVRPITVTSTPFVHLEPVHYGSKIEAVGVSTPAPFIASQTYNKVISNVQPIVVSSTPTIPLNKVQYGIKTISSPIGYQYPKPAIGLSYPKNVYSTQAPPVISYTYQKPLVKTQPIQPIVVSTPSTPVVDYSYEQPLKPVHIAPAVSYSIRPKPIQPIVISTPAVPLNPIQYVNPISVSTPAPPVIDYSYKQPLKPVIPIAVGKPSPPLVSYSYKQPIVPVPVSTPAPPAVSYSITPKPIQPIVVSNTPAVPLNPVQYVNPISVSTPAPPLVDYSYKQPIKHVIPVGFSKPVSPVVSYSYKPNPIQPIVVSSTPTVPLNPVQYVKPISISTPAPPVVDYSYQQPIKPVVPISVSTPAPALVSYSIKSKPIQPIVVSSTPAIPFNPVQYNKPTPFSAPHIIDYSYKQPIKPVIPISYSTPSPPIGYSIKSKPIQPIVVSSTPAVPLNPVQYVNPIPISTPAPPIIDYSYRQPVQPVVPISVSTPAPPLVDYSYKQPIKPVIPISYSTPSPPVVDYSYKQPVQPVVPISVSTPAPPLVDYSYKQPIKPVIPISYSTPSPPVVDYSYKQPIKPVIPISYSTPSPPVVDYSYRQPVKPVVPISVSTPAPHFVDYSYRQPVKPVVPISVTTPAPHFVDYSYKQPVKPVIPISYSTPSTPVVDYSYRQPVQPVVPISVSTPAPPLVDYSYKQPIKPVIPISYSTPSPPVVDYSYKQPVQPVVPISVSTPAPPVVDYSYKQPIKPEIPISYSTPSPPVVDYSYKQPIKPVIPISYSTPSPPVVDYSYRQPVKPVVPISVSTPAPHFIDYSYKQPVKPLLPITVSSTPVVPLNPVQYVKRPSVPIVDYSYQAPLKPVAPITYSTPAPPVVSYSYRKPVTPVSTVISTPAPYVTDSFNFEPLRTIKVSSTPVVPLNPVQYVKPSYSLPAPIKPITYTTPAPPVVSYSYKAKPLQHITVSSTPVVPLNPVQYVKPLPVITPSPPVVNYSYKQPVSPVTITTPASTIDYSYRKPLEPYAVNKATNVVFSYSFEANPVQKISVSTTPAIPLNPVQYSIKPAPAFNYQPTYTSTYTTPSVPVVNYSYRRPVKPLTFTNQPYQPSVVTSAPKVGYSYQEVPDYFVKTKTVSPVSVTSTPLIPLNPVQYTSTTPQPIINYKYQNPVIKTQSVVEPAPIDYYDEILHGDIVKIPPKPAVNSYYEVPTRTTTYAPVTVASTPVVPLNPVQYVKQPLPVHSYNYELPQVATYKTKGCCSSPSIKVSTIKPEILQSTIAPSNILSHSRKPVVGAYFEENFETTKQNQGYVYSRPNIKLEERPLIKQGIYSTVSPLAIPAEISTSTHLQRPVQTYANTVEEESYISNTPEHVATIVKQPISIDTGDENLNLHLDIPKIGVSRPIFTSTETPQQQIVEVTTVTPVVKRVRIKGGLARGGYYVRRQKVKVQPVITTTENYPAYFTSTIKPIYSSTIDLTSPTLYSTTVRPSTVYTTPSTTTTLDDNELELEDQDDDARLLAQVSGQFGEIINVGNQGIIRQGVSSTTVSSLEDGEAIIGVVKKERVEGGRKKAKVVVVSKLSDFNPLLVGKLGAECSCKSNSKTLNLQRSSSRPRGQQLFYPEVDNVHIPSRGYLPSSPEPPRVKSYYLPASEVPLSDPVTSTTIASASYESEPFVEIKPLNKVLYTTTGSPIEVSSGEYDITTKRSISKNRIGLNQEKTLSKGASFDRYGPGGLRGTDETLQGSIDCQRPGLFRHPKYCNKFYACNWDQWKKRFTLHVFNCPIHLAYDSQLGACNWPSKGPACADDNLLV